MQTLTGMHGTHTYAHKRKHAYTQTCSRNRPSHSPNQFHSQASCQAAMLSKYYHNACVSLNVQLMNGWHPVKTLKQKNCPLTFTVLERLLYLPTSLTPDSSSVFGTSSLSLTALFLGFLFVFCFLFCFVLWFFGFFLPLKKISGGPNRREEEKIGVLHLSFFRFWNFTESRNWLWSSGTSTWI